MHKLYIFTLLLAGLISACGKSDESNIDGKIKLFNTDWEFSIDSTGLSDPAQLQQEGTSFKWEAVTLPHTAHIEPLVVNDQWQGNCWYRKSFSFDDNWSGKKLFLRFEGAMHVAEVWVNGIKKITHSGGYLPFVVDITEDLLREESNAIHVKLNNEDNPLTGPKPLEILDFNMYGGLYRDVFLLIKNPVHITDPQFASLAGGGGIFVTFPEVSQERARVSVKTHIFNSGDKAVKTKVQQSLEHEGNAIASVSETINLAPGESKEISQEMDVLDPMLWSPGTPNLYDLLTTVGNKHVILDREITRIGIRKFEFKENRLFINGEETFLRGVNRHQEYPYIGYALSNNAQYRDALKIKEAGFDYVRLSHYPHSTAFMDACDELGIVTIDAILGWQYYIEDEKFKDHVVQTCRDMIRRDRNHASVLAWEVSLNESWMPEPFIDRLVEAAREEYPGEACITAGWQRYGYDIYLQARQHRLGHHNDYTEKPYVVSEYGDWEYYAMNAGLNQDVWGELLEEERSSRQPRGSGEKRLLQQALNLQEAHNDNFTTPAFADGYWVMYDYNRGYANDLEFSGIMDIFRLPKYSYYFFKSQRSPGEVVAGEPNAPMVFIVSENSGASTKDIRVFSNCQEVELQINGEPQGKQLPDQDRISGHLNHPPFTFKDVPVGNGTLKAIGKINGESVAEHILSIQGKPVKIMIRADMSGKQWKSGVKDAIFLYAQAVDENGRVVYNYSENVSFKLSGKASIIGGEESKAEGGIATVLAIAGDEPGKIEITAVSGELQSDPLIIVTK